MGQSRIMAKTKRIGILREDARKLADWFHTADTDRVTFQVVFHRIIETLEVFFANDENNVLDELTKKWAIEDANESHAKEASK